jgi:hypothetical protein
MKRGGLLLLAIIFLTYGYQGYKAIDAHVNDKVTIKTSGKLSDIAGRVTPVPLEMPGSGVLRNIRQVRKDGDDLFLLSENRLLHFDVRGKFVNRIAGDMNDALIAAYALDTDRSQVVVIDSQRNVSRYGYDGSLLSKAGLEHPWHRLTAFAFHDGFLWAAAETLVESDGACLISQNLYRLDAGMNEVSRMTLRAVDAGRYGSIAVNPCISELLADEAGVYAYSPPFETRYLLEDTLHIVQQKLFPLPGNDANSDRTAGIYPVRKGKRHIISTGKSLDGNRFTFCYDSARYTAHILTEGFKDDFFGTGYIADFLPVDIYGNSYCFVKAGEDLSAKFPERAANGDLPVLFIVNLSV